GGGGEAAGGLVGEAEAAEETEPFITVHASGEPVTCPSRFRDERAHKVQRRDGGADPNRVAVARDDEVSRPLAAGARGAEVHETDRLLRGPAPWAGDSRHRHGDVCAEPPTRPASPRRGG